VLRLLKNFVDKAPDEKHYANDNENVKADERYVLHDILEFVSHEISLF
jgi:hypothetical protein